MIDKVKVVEKWCNITNALIAKYKDATDHAYDLDETYEELCSLEDILVRLNYVTKRDIKSMSLASNKLMSWMKDENIKM